MEPNKSFLVNLVQRYPGGNITAPESRELFARLKENAAALEATLPEPCEAAFKGSPALAGDTNRRIPGRLTLQIIRRHRGQ